MTTNRPFDLSPDVFQRLEHGDVFERMRAEDPVHCYTDEDGKTFGCLTRHAAVQMTNRDIDTFTVTRGHTLIDVDADPLSGAMSGKHVNFGRRSLELLTVG